jgi:hypothetical protein
VEKLHAKLDIFLLCVDKRPCLPGAKREDKKKKRMEIENK